MDHCRRGAWHQIPSPCPGLVDVLRPARNRSRSPLPDAPEDPSDGLFEAGPSSKEKQAPGLHDVFHAAGRSPPSLAIKNKALAVMQVPFSFLSMMTRRSLQLPRWKNPASRIVFAIPDRLCYYSSARTRRPRPVYRLLSAQGQYPYNPEKT